MSKILSRTSDRRVSSQRKKWLEKNARLKPFGFCCTIDQFDPLATYDQRMPPYKSTMTAITSVHECPVSKMQMEFFMPHPVRTKSKTAHIKALEAGDQLPRNDKTNYPQIDKNNRSIKWHLEDEIVLAKDIFWTQKQKLNYEESNKAINIAMKKHRKKYESLLSKKYPRWYQDFSLFQIKNLMNLENVMRADYEKRITNGTQTTLMAIGVTSTFFKLKPNVIKLLLQSCSLNNIMFLRQIYKIFTGIDFQEEGYKKYYDCNERIILSAIAFLTLPETLEELHKRLPEIAMPRMPSKPKPPICPMRQKNKCPYKEELFTRPDWVSYRRSLQEWWKQYKLFPIPKVILPLHNKILSEANKEKRKDICIEETKMKDLQKVSAIKFGQKNAINTDQRKYEDKNVLSDENLNKKKSATSDIHQLKDKSNKFNFTITGLGENAEAVEYKICGSLKPPQVKQQLWQSEKDSEYVTLGESEKPPNYPVTYEAAGVTNVTSKNSDERFFTVLKLGDGTKKIYPKGRENLSKNWQEWLQNADEEFRQVERQANNLIKSIYATMKLVFEPNCDNCCSCRQTKKTHQKLREIKTPYMLIDNIVQDEEKNKYLIGSIALHSPAPSPTVSAVNLLEIIASEDKIKTNVIINGVTDENGKTQYYITGIQKDKIHIPAPLPASDSAASQSIKNVPPCACAIQQIFNKDISPSTSKDNPLWAKEKTLCFGTKYRPNEIPAFSCKMYPDDQSCSYEKGKGTADDKREKEEIDDISDFQSCEDKDGINICKTCDASNILSSEDLAKQENSKKETRNIPCRDEKCLFNPQSKALRKEITDKEKVEIISDFNYPNYQNDSSSMVHAVPSSAISLGKVQTIVHSEESSNSREHRPEKKSKDCEWRTKSEEELPAKKTLTYLCEPDYPLETVTLHSKGRPCHCRENRSKKKKLMYNVGGLVNAKKRGKTKLGGENRIIEGVTYLTPPVSPRRSDEYVPEYDLLEPSYNTCVGKTADETSKLIERYSGPKSLTKKIQKNARSCNYSNFADTSAEVKKDSLSHERKDIEQARRNFIESKPPEERWAIALKDTGLMDHFTPDKVNVPCWTTCAKFDRNIGPRRLKMKKPVCECKYERKILERNEEKTKWKTRQQKLKSLKKQPFMHVVGTSRPLVTDTKFVISGVKRIPRKDELVDDIKYCISGVAETVSMLPPQRIVEGLNMSTPFETPQLSKEDILQTDLHRHWSPTNISPGPLPRKDVAVKKRTKPKMEIRDEMFSPIYDHKNKQDMSDLSNCQEVCSDQQKLIKQIGKDSTSKKKTVPKESINHQLNVTHKEIVLKTAHENGYSEKAIDEFNHRSNDDQNILTNGSDDKTSISKLNIQAIIKTELKKMATEGYIFAKLPQCHLMPQLQYWIMYREGIAFSQIDKKNSMLATVIIWQMIEKLRQPMIKTSLDMTMQQLQTLTYDRAEEMKKKIAEKKAIFYSKVRKGRVSRARLMWFTMEFGKFPSESFKNAYFTYMASKESDGHVFRPWMHF